MEEMENKVKIENEVEMDTTKEESEMKEEFSFLNSEVDADSWKKRRLRKKLIMK